MKEAIHKITGMDSYKQMLKDLHSLKITLENRLAKSVSHKQISNIETELE